MRWAPLLVVLITIVADAHVAPSVDDNNRYLKVTPQADRVRLAYTVFFGEVPGKAARPTLDKNRDGTISDDEAQAWGDRLAADVLADLDVTVDAKQQRIVWKAVSVGLGSPTTDGGSFSIDMIAYLCFPGRGHHTATVRDRYRVPNPGETEVLVEDGPGIKIEHARIGSATALSNDFKFVGPGGPLTDDGLDVAFVADDTAPASNDGACVAAPSAPSNDAGPPWLVIGIAGAVVAAGTILLAYKRRSHS
jgi:hypothetical protein